MYEIKNLNNLYNNGETDSHVLKGIDLSIVLGDCQTILGPSGSGKSILLNILGGLDLEF